MSHAYSRGPYRRKTLSERFLAKVVVGAEEECWEWKAATAARGYGVLGEGGIDGRMVYAHRVAWEMANGPIPEGLHVCHHCDNPPCVNPAHLFVGTRSDNLKDMVAKGRQGGGPQGIHTKHNIGDPRRIV